MESRGSGPDDDQHFRQSWQKFNHALSSARDGVKSYVKSLPFAGQIAVSLLSAIALNVVMEYVSSLLRHVLPVLGSIAEAGFAVQLTNTHLGIVVFVVGALNVYLIRRKIKALEMNLQHMPPEQHPEPARTDGGQQSTEWTPIILGAILGATITHAFSPDYVVAGAVMGAFLIVEFGLED